MEKVKWKNMAIILFIIVVLETLFIIWAYSLAVQEEENTYECFYEICEDYPDAFYESPVCSCYDYDVMGNLIVAKEKYMK